MTTRALLLTAATIAAIAVSPAEAKHQRHARHAPAAGIIVCDMQGCHTTGAQAPVKYDAPVERETRTRVAHVDANGNTVVGGRPHGCPYEFCGCEASLYVFGEIRRELNLASNWMRKFPRTSPAPGMAAARNHHVMILVRHVSGSDWLVHDGNSGHHMTHDHIRSIAGYVIVDPHAHRYAMVD